VASSLKRSRSFMSFQFGKRAFAYCLSMIPRVKPEGMLFGKPVSTLHRVRGMLFRIML